MQQTMSSSTLNPGLTSKPGPSPLPSLATNNQAILLEKLNARRSTPDSEALASSDDEPDLHRPPQPPPVQPQKPVRRASWLNDTSQTASRPRKGSFASSSMSPTASHPSTPSVDTAAAAVWGSHSTSSGVLSRSHGNPSTLSWGTGIWTTERKDPPSRLTEVLPSPTSLVPPSSASGNPLFADGGSPGPREQAPNSQIPFPIPLHPTPKTYRSQSYSVGQLEPDAATTTMPPAAAINARSRPVPHSGLQHRPSRPSMLSEVASDGSTLGKVNEDDDDDSTGSMHGSQLQSAEAKTIEMLTRENAMLRQQQQQQQQQQQYHQNPRLRPRASTAANFPRGNGYMQESVPEESDFAVDELDDLADDFAGNRAPGRRMSEYNFSPFFSSSFAQEKARKGLWQTSLGFSLSDDISQSRRHSFADVPPRQGSIASIGESVASRDHGPQDSQYSQGFSSPYAENNNYPASNSASAYFNAAANLPQQQHAMAQPALGGQYPSSYASLHSNYSNRTASPHRNIYGLAQPRHNQLLHVVLFKCARADVFYIQEGTGLTVKPGDLVIVEADRGTDLGTVARDNVDWQTAKELKETYAEEQYKWLMMYSHNAAAAQDGAGAGLLAASNGLQASAVGGMGPPNPHHVQEPTSGELKPKLIKRLAQGHEVQALREKEGNEAKAKRVCMQKVKEHGLNMEILDAEFQMDWKKLTFYYFADSYINFNSLVTDLFKIYKTRIWMSAINPASFASPTLGLQAPSGVGPGAVGVGRGPGGGSDRRQNHAVSSEQQGSGSAFSMAAQNSRAIRPSNSHPSFNEPTPGYAASNYPYNAYGGAFGNTPQPRGAGYSPGIMQSTDQFPSNFPQSNDYLSRGRFPPPQMGGPQNERDVSPLSQQSEWFGAFQGLSLNSR